MPKIALYLMNQKGLNVLSTIIEKYTSNIIEYVVLSKDKAVEKDYYEELESVCLINGIDFYNDFEDIIRPVEYKFAIGWRKIIPSYENLIVFHDSILPKYRGFSPLVNMLINGETEIGVTALYALQEYDRGPIILQLKNPIKYPIKIADAIEIVSELYQNIVCEIIEKIVNNEIIMALPQCESDATYSVWRDDDDYFIDWRKDSGYIKRSIDALGFPYKGARTRIKDKCIIIDEAQIVDDVSIENRDCGKVIFFEEGCPVVICGSGLLKITSLRDDKQHIALSNIKFRTRFGG